MHTGAVPWTWCWQIQAQLHKKVIFQMMRHLFCGYGEGGLRHTGCGRMEEVYVLHAQYLLTWWEKCRGLDIIRLICSTDPLWASFSPILSHLWGERRCCKLVRGRLCLILPPPLVSSAGTINQEYMLLHRRTSSPRALIGRKGVQVSAEDTSQVLSPKVGHSMVVDAEQ
jgi:hypothetical protein